MKKIVYLIAAGMLSIGSVSAATNATTTLRVTVPRILEVTAEPTSIAHTMTESELAGTKYFPDIEFKMYSNDVFNVKTEYSSEAFFTNASTSELRDASLLAFRRAMSFARNTDNRWYSLEVLEGLQPFNEPGNQPTTAAGYDYKYFSSLTNLGFNAIPGVYKVYLTVTLTQQ